MSAKQILLAGITIFILYKLNKQQSGKKQETPGPFAGLVDGLKESIKKPLSEIPADHPEIQNA